MDWFFTMLVFSSVVFVLRSMFLSGKGDDRARVLELILWAVLYVDPATRNPTARNPLARNNPKARNPNMRNNGWLLLP